MKNVNAAQFENGTMRFQIDLDDNTYYSFEISKETLDSTISQQGCSFNGIELTTKEDEEEIKETYEEKRDEKDMVWNKIGDTSFISYGLYYDAKSYTVYKSVLDVDYYIVKIQCNNEIPEVIKIIGYDLNKMRDFALFNNIALYYKETELDKHLFTEV